VTYPPILITIHSFPLDSPPDQQIMYQPIPVSENRHWYKEVTGPQKTSPNANRVNMTLEETYYEINRNLGNNAEPLKSVRLLETYRRYLKPETVRVVLLAESHVFTSDEDRRIAIPPIDDLPGYPT
jgi:hypothetical protein